MRLISGTTFGAAARSRRAARTNMDARTPAPARRLADIRRPKKRPRRANGDATRNKILDAAERLFAEHGYTAVSMRSITAAAGVNVAAIHFHFASKEALFEAIFNRRVQPINAARLVGLHGAQGSANAGGVELANVLKAFVAPHLEAAKGFDAGSIVLLQFMARAAAEPDKSIQAVLSKQFDPVWMELTKAVRRALPDASDEAIGWGLFFTLGALYFINPSRGWLAPLTGNKCDPTDTEAAMQYLVPFLTAGLQGLSKSVPGIRPKPARRKGAAKSSTKRLTPP
jgi:AcrR family transcriptional regulator